MFLEIFDQINTCFKCRKRIFPRKDHFSQPPLWVIHKNLMQIYYNQKLFFEKGTIALGCVVAANALLFKRFNNKDCPASFLYTNEEYYYRFPNKLLSLASEIFTLKERSDLTPEEQFFADILKDEHQYIFNKDLPFTMTDGRIVKYTTAMVCRKHIPKSRLCNFFYPLLTLPEEEPDAVILPKWYWPAILKSKENFT